MRASEFIPESKSLEEVGLKDHTFENFIAFTFCDIPIIYHKSSSIKKINIIYQEDKIVEVEGLILDAEHSAHVFNREKRIIMIEVYLEPLLD